MSKKIFHGNAINTAKVYRKTCERKGKFLYGLQVDVDRDGFYSFGYRPEFTPEQASNLVEVVEDADSLREIQAYLAEFGFKTEIINPKSDEYDETQWVWLDKYHIEAELDIYDQSREDDENIGIDESDEADAAPYAVSDDIEYQSFYAA